MALKIIAAVAENGVIGKDGSLPWRLPEDLTRFRELTEGNIVLMGRKTYWSLPVLSRPLPNRENIVLTHSPHHVVGMSGATVIDNFEQVLDRSRIQNIFVIGGGEIYSLALPYVDEMFITRVHVYLPGNVFFPEFREGYWNLTFSERRAEGNGNQYNFTWQVWKRASEPASR